MTGISPFPGKTRTNRIRITHEFKGGEYRYFYIIPLHAADLRSVVLDWTLSNTINWKTEFLS